MTDVELIGSLVLWRINLYRLFNAKSIFMQIVSSISNNSVCISISYYSVYSNSYSSANSV